MTQNENQPVRRILPLKDIGIWSAEAIGVALGIYTAGLLGLPNIYSDIATQIGPALNTLQSIPDIIHNPQALKPVATGLGFVTGLTVTAISIPEVLLRLKGKATLHGTGNFEREEGGRIMDQNCGDNRIEREQQEAVELGAGLMGGGFVRDNITALLLHNLPVDHPLKNFAIGYMLGRSTPTALLTGVNTQITALKTLLDSSKKGFLKLNAKPHDKGCGMSTTTSFFPKHFLKFSKNHHEAKIQLLDRLNWVDAQLNTLVWEPLMNFFATPISGLSFMISPYFGTTSIHEPHEKHS